MSKALNTLIQDIIPLSLKRRLIVYSVLAGIATTFTIVLVSSVPLYCHLEQDQAETLVHDAQSRSKSLNFFLQDLENSVLQITNLTLVRQQLEAYNNGQISLNTLVQSSQTILQDRLIESDNILGIVRYGRDGQVVIRTGSFLPIQFWPVDLEQSRKILISDPVIWDEQFYLMVQAPIISPSSKEQVGTDVILFDAAPIQNLLLEPANDVDGRVFLARAHGAEYGPTLDILEFGTFLEPHLKRRMENALTTIDHFDHSSSQVHSVELKDDGFLLAVAPVQGTDFLTLVLLEESELYASIRKQFLYFTVLVIFFSGLQVLGSLLLLRSAARQVWSRAKHLQTLNYKLQAACEQSPASIVITNLKGCIEYINPKFERITGYTSDEIIGKKMNVLKSGLTSAETYQELWRTIIGGKEWCGQLMNRRKNGELFWESISISPIRNELGHITHFVGVKEDITAYKQAEEKLFVQANYDVLTGLANRKLGFERLEESLKQVQLQSVHLSSNIEEVAVIFLDLDEFKQINDSLGHDAGDQLLRDIAQRLQKVVRSTDTVARLGGDEFLIIVPHLKNSSMVKAIARKILAAVSEPLMLKNEEIIISASLGIACYPKDGCDPAQLVQQADTAMYDSKRKGRNAFSCFSQSMNDAVQSKLRVESRLRCALAKQEIFVQYQPFIELATNQVIGAEALIRWEHTELGRISPEQFIPIAEDTGIIHDLGKWIMMAACEAAMGWPIDRNHLRVAVNISPHQLRDPYFLAIVLDSLEASGLPYSCLELEITEQRAIENLPNVKTVLNQVRSYAIHLAIDDFGTGYSSLSYLRQYPFTTVKIDRMFIHDLPYNPEAVSLVKAILAIAKELKLKTIAEGIETLEQAEFLIAHGCDYGQGYWFSKPLSGSEFRQFVVQRATIEMLSDTRQLESVIASGSRGTVRSSSP